MAGLSTNGRRVPTSRSATETLWLGPSSRYSRAHDYPTHGPRGHRGRRPGGRDGVLRRARTQAAGRGAGRGRLGGPRGGARGVRAEIAMVETPDGHGRLELTKFHAPSGRGGDRHAPANTPGIRHVAFAVDAIDAVVTSLRARGAELVGEVERYEDSYRLCYVRGPEGIIVELAEQIG